MKLLIKIVLIAVLSYFAGPYFPWWFAGLVSFVVSALIPGKHAHSFWAGFVAVGLVWLGLALRLHWQAQAPLTQAMAQLLQVQEVPYLMVVTALVGALVGGSFGLSGSTFRSLFIRKRRDRYYS
ncbi:hypothetical protein QWY31_13885 [Cytophagales bacterium LB-30]|uniref:Uncharacterized protein n=1 Tax=Shiella aurantiaca TaxID=3058365 RepID=A0ABT8F888_9BACT|nr:hypothetical protein [Shiella aurantiaca]MDN4166595.1 hypothetical protein [Shiella aurantiaca]